MASTSGDSRSDWFTSSYSTATSDNCVEVNLSSPLVRVRDSKAREQGELGFPPAAWLEFLQALRTSAQ